MMNIGPPNPAIRFLYNTFLRSVLHVPHVWISIISREFQPPYVSENTFKENVGFIKNLTLASSPGMALVGDLNRIHNGESLQRTIDNILEFWKAMEK